MCVVFAESEVIGMLAREPGAVQDVRERLHEPGEGMPVVRRQVLQVQVQAVQLVRQQPVAKASRQRLLRRR